MHARVGLQLIRGDGETLATTLHDQVLAPWAELNFGSSEAAPWPEWDVEPPEDAKAHAGIFVSLGTALAQMQAAGVNVDIEALVERFNLPLLAGEPTTTPTPPAEEPKPAPAGGTPAGDAPLAEGPGGPVARLASGDAPSRRRAGSLRASTTRTPSRTAFATGSPRAAPASRGCSRSSRWRGHRRPARRRARPSQANASH